MRIRDFVADLKSRLQTLPKDDPRRADVAALCWVAADSELPASTENLKPFIDVLIKLDGDHRQAYPELAASLALCLKAPQIREAFVWDMPSLVTAMANYPASERVDALTNFNVAKLSKIILNGTAFRQVVNNKENYIGDEDHARTVLMALGYYYHELTRTRTDDYKHITGSLTGYNRAIKQEGAHLILKFLESGESLSNFEAYLNSDVCKAVKGATSQGELGDLCKMVIFVSKPENRQPVEARPKNWFGF